MPNTAPNPQSAAVIFSPPEGLINPISDGWGSWDAKSMMWLKSIINVKGAL